MAGYYVSQKNQVMAKVKSDLEANCTHVAQEILKCSNARIQSNVGREGLALGSGADEQDLAASGYLATATKSGYSAAKARAGGGDASRFADKAVVGSGTHEFRIKVAYALDRAALMHNGYYDPRAQRFMDGTKFLTECADSHFPQLKARAEIDIESLPSLFNAETREQRLQRLGEESQLAEMDKIVKQLDSDAKTDNNVLGMMGRNWEEFLEHTEAYLTARRVFKEPTRRYRAAHTRTNRKTGKVSFVPGHYVESFIWVKEDEQTWMERLEDLYTNYELGAGFGGGS